MTKRMALMLLIAGLIFGGIFGFQAFKSYKIKQYLSSQGVPPQTVSTIKAGFQEWQPELSAVGTLRAVRGADLAAEVSGVISAIHFRSGEEVKAGAPLVQLNAATDIAQLESLKANAELAELTYRRDQRQLKVQAVSQATVDADAANLKVAKARVAEQQALVDKKYVRAPFAGRLGLRAVDLGQYVAPGTKLVTLQSLDPVYVDFSVPQSGLAEVRKGLKVSARTDALPDERFEGTIDAIDAKVDPSTRNVQVRAALSNPHHRLLPGMFVTVAVNTGESERHLTLPQSAISFNPYGNTVFVVEEKGKGPDGKPKLVATQRFVTTGATRGDQIAIVSGVKQGETVVTAGQLKLRNGVPVIINNSVQPSNDAAPQPKDE
ncbi:MAG TPA: efflux RND transporter periplasmic adaptor subunit [Burkholderiales bacterium]|nr:efflux RND transporter periplasmic adaptor subunit [Burkholderiales bacterium]